MIKAVAWSWRYDDLLNDEHLASFKSKTITKEFAFRWPCNSDRHKIDKQKTLYEWNKI